MRNDAWCLALLGLTLMVNTASSQERSWGLAAEIALSSFSGNAHDTTGSGTNGHPSRATSIGLRFDKGWGAWRFALGALYTSTGVEISDESLEVIGKSAFSLYEFAPELAFQVLSLRSAGVFRVHAGLLIDRWHPVGSEARVLLGGSGAVSLELPITSRTSAQVRWETSTTGSVFRDDEVPTGYELRRSWRNRVGLGVRLGF